MIDVLSLYTVGILFHIASGQGTWGSPSLLLRVTLRNISQCSLFYVTISQGRNRRLVVEVQLPTQTRVKQVYKIVTLC